MIITPTKANSSIKEISIIKINKLVYNILPNPDMWETCTNTVSQDLKLTFPTRLSLYNIIRFLAVSVLSPLCVSNQEL